MVISLNTLSKTLKVPIDHILNYKEHPEAAKYDGCEFKIDNRKYIFRTAKVTPKKIGFFVTLWKRDKSNITVPLNKQDNFHALILVCTEESHKGLFLFSKEVLSIKGVLSTSNKAQDGKRGFRVYAPWSKPESKQAFATKTWQVNYFLKEDQLSLLSS